jgi:alkanesulfonate monooxygenase SsuD/methylene tetrahydromethanopterin reductase-like flavin-dependent oxidoreductase (luciferase family)
MVLPVLVSDDDGAASRAERLFAQLTATGGRFPEDYMVAGTPATIVERLRQFAEQGCTNFTLMPLDQGTGLRPQIAVLAEEVLPFIRSYLPTM